MDESTVFPINCGFANDDATAEIVGSKAANLIRMAQAGLPVPPGFVLPSAMCGEYFRCGGGLPDAFVDLLAGAIRHVENASGLKFGGERRPLLVSVRSGAAVSMPGMLDTLLNIGLNDRTLAAMIRTTGNPRHAWDSYRRLIQAYAEVVHGLSADPFECCLQEFLQREAATGAGELDTAALKSLSQEYLVLFEEHVGRPFPQEPLTQLSQAVEAVFRSWQIPRATEFRRMHHLENLAGTAVTVQAMVFGNLGGASGSGVAFSRDPSTGEDRPYLDFVWNAQGEDIVAGRHTVESGSLSQGLPEVYRELKQIGRRLEQLFGDAQDLEFTVQDGCLFLLQSRTAKRTPWAALRIACDLVREGLIDEATALERLSQYDLNSICSVRLARATNAPLATGTPASPGVAVGAIALNPQTAAAWAKEGKPVVLVRPDITPDDIVGLSAAAGILTAHGSRTSHAAVIARQLNKVCIVGCRQLAFDADVHRCRLGERWLHEGEHLSLDGHTGCIYAGKLEIIIVRPDDYLAEVKRWMAGR